MIRVQVQVMEGLGATRFFAYHSIAGTILDSSMILKTVLPIFQKKSHAQIWFKIQFNIYL